MFTDEMTTAQRVAAAKATMTKVLDHFLYLLELHENNAIIVYSPHLSDQIPTSYAANAFNVFQSGMHRLEIIRLCALWDKAEREKECVPTVIELIDNADVLNALADETHNHWVTLEGCILNPAEDPELAREVQEILRRSNAQIGAAGGCPSPIIDGHLLSMPIPSGMATPTRFGDLNGLYGSLVSDLTRGRLTARDWCHLDPDINPDSLPRQTGWRARWGKCPVHRGICQ
jgi:hypothetical protein